MGRFFEGFGFNQALGSLGSLFGAFQTNNNINKQIAAQAEENRKNREYNLMLAKQQNQWNLDQWNRENAYNDPTAQMQRLRNAGLNPDLVYGSGSAANLSAASPEMTAGEGSLPVDMSAIGRKRTIGETIMDAQQIANVQADTEKKKADTEGTDAKTEGQKIENSIRALDKKYHSRFLNQQLVNLQDVHHQNMEQIELLRSQVADVDEDVMSKSIDNDFKKFYKTEYYEYLRSQYKITNEDAKRAEAMTKALIRSANAKADYDEDLAIFTKRIHEQDLKLDDVLSEVTGETGYAKLFGAILKYLLRSK